MVCDLEVLPYRGVGSKGAVVVQGMFFATLDDVFKLTLLSH